MAAPVPIPRSEGTPTSGPHYIPAVSVPTPPSLLDAIERQGSDVFQMEETLESLGVPVVVAAARPQDIESPTAAELKAARNSALRVTLLADPRDDHERRVLAAARAAKRECTGKTGVDIRQVHERMLARGYAMEMHETVHRGPRFINRNCLERLTHTFLVCKGYNDGKELMVQGDLIVDPEFRSHFYIGQENPIYSYVVSLIPDEFVGPVMRLRAVVEAMSNAMTYAFRARGMPPPPWRKLRSILSKWGAVPGVDGQGLMGGVAGQARISLDPNLPGHFPQGFNPPPGSPPTPQHGFQYQPPHDAAAP